MNTPLQRELSSIKEPGRDITNPILAPGNPLPKADTVLTQFGGGDLSLYEQLGRHPKVFSAWQQRSSAVTGKPTLVDPGGGAPIDREAADWWRETLNHLGEAPIDFSPNVGTWDVVCSRMHQAVRYGYAVGELMLRPGRNGVVADLAEIRVRKQKRFAFDNTGALRLLTQAQPYTGELMPWDKFWVWSWGAEHGDDPWGRGLFYYLYWPVFSSSNVKRLWLEKLEKWTGMVAAYADDEPDATKRVENLRIAAEGLRGDNVASLPSQMLETLKLVQVSLDPAMFRELVDVVADDIVQVILSQTMTTMDGASLSQAKVHKQVADSVIRSDADQLCASFRVGPMARLTQLNFPSARTPLLRRDCDEAVDMEKQAKVVQILDAAGWEFDPAKIEQTFGAGITRKAPPAGPASFAEGDAQDAARTRNRIDHQGLAEASEGFASQWRDYVDETVGEAMAMIRESGDVATAHKHLTALLSRQPNAAAVRALERGGFTARLLGALRGQRR